MGQDAAASQKQLAREWLQSVCDRFGVTPRSVAVKAKVSPSTVYRALDPDSDFTPSLTTLGKIAAAWSVPMPGLGTAASAPAPAGFYEPEVQQLADAPPLAPRAVTNDQSVWTVRTRALELAGVLTGDVVTIDMSVAPRAGDLVCAQVYDFDRGSAETRIRQCKPPYIVTRTMDGSVDDEPLLVDGKRVAIIGTVIRLVRSRAA